MKSKLSVFIIAFNEERIIEQCLKKLDWVDEIIVVDSGSTDATVAICEKYNAKVVYNKFVDFGNQKQFALEQTTNDWVLSLDADEVMSDALIDEIQKRFEGANTKIGGYYLKIRMVFLGKTFKYGSESNRDALRLFNKNFGQFDLKSVHESVIVEGETLELKNYFLHYSFDSLNSYIVKLNKYTELYSKSKFTENKKYTVLEIIVKTKFEFIKKYFLELNFLNGKEGFFWAVFSSFYTFTKCAKTNDLWRNNPLKQ